MPDETRLASVRAQLAGTVASIAGGLASPSLVALPVPPGAFQIPGMPERTRLLRDATVIWRPAGSETVLAGFGREMRLRGPRDSSLHEAARTLREATALPWLGRAGGRARPAFFGGARFVAGGSMRDPAWDPFGGWAFVLPPKGSQA